MAYDLSVIIPARNEYYYDLDLLGHTVQNVLDNSSDRTEIICILDGAWSLNPLSSSPRLTVIHHNKSIGQRAACNEGARVSRAKFIMKLDAHCALDKDFDAKLMSRCEYGWTVIPVQYNLHAFSWKCKACGHETYQGPKPERCKKCRSRYTKIAVKWLPRGWKERNGKWEGNPKTTSWRFDTEPKFQYFGEFGNRPHIKQLAETTGFTPTMSCLGACWFLHRERYWELDGMDEKHGSWGSMGIELACKSWLSGGQMVVNHSTWFAHLFRTQNGFSFPYPNSGAERAKARAREIWLHDAWPKAKHPLSWLIKQFAPVPDWNIEQPEIGILYYTCNTHDETLELAARNNLLRSRNGYELGCVSRERTDFGDWNIVVQADRSAATMHEQILQGLERMRAEYVFLCESDVFYHPSHFEFVPPRKDRFYYNTNVWRVRYEDGHAVRTDDCKQVSGLCADRLFLLEHYRKRVERIRREGFSRKNGFEPGTRKLPWGYDDNEAEVWQSPFPNLDVTAHGQTLTQPKFSVDEFRNKKYAVGWQETDDALPGWERTAGRMKEWLEAWLTSA